MCGFGSQTRGKGSFEIVNGQQSCDGIDLFIISQRKLALFTLNHPYDSIVPPYVNDCHRRVGYHAPLYFCWYSPCGVVPITVYTVHQLYNDSFWRVANIKLDIKCLFYFSVARQSLTLPNLIRRKIITLANASVYRMYFDCLHRVRSHFDNPWNGRSLRLFTYGGIGI